MNRAFGALLLCLPAMASGQPLYTIVNLEALGGPPNGSTGAYGVNERGEVVGSYWTPDYAQLRVFRYADGIGITDLGLTGGDHTYALSINDQGQIAAFGAAVPGGPYLGYRYTSGLGFVPLGSLGGRETEARSINNQGQVTGFSETFGGQEHAFRYTDGLGMQDLGTLYGRWSKGYAINNLGWVTGISDGDVFLYQDAVGMTSLGEGIGWAINDQGVVAGATLRTASGGQAFICRNGQMELLGSLGGPSEARGINNRNEVVGWAYAPGLQMRAFRWSEGEGMVDLNSLIDPNGGWRLWAAMDINDAGQIVGIGWFNGKDTAFRLDPVPAPSLRIELRGTNVIISWDPHWSKPVLEAAESMEPGAWRAVPGGATSPVVLPATQASRFFRLNSQPTYTPRLSLRRSGSNLVISWTPDEPGWVLESSPSLLPPMWTPVPGGTNSPVTVPLSGAAHFFRLRK